MHIRRSSFLDGDLTVPCLTFHPDGVNIGIRFQKVRIEIINAVIPAPWMRSHGGRYGTDGSGRLYNPRQRALP